MSRSQHSGEYVCGFHAVTVALKIDPGSITEICLQAVRDDQRARQLVTLAQQHGVPVQRMERDQLDALTEGVRHQGVVARVARRASVDESCLDDLVKEHGTGLLLLVLDGVQDPHNLGACLRTADAAGVQAVIIPRDNAVAVTATVRKVASGAAEALPVVTVTNLSRALEHLRQLGVWLVGTADAADKSLYDIDLTGPIAIVLGAEGKGMRRLTRERCDFLVRIPMSGAVESLNVSVAAGVCLFESRRQRLQRHAG
jgi:23S rRNA (guanosine2251-2'-O)-methyltransferase